jgi:hypothetical protein
VSADLDALDHGVIEAGQLAAQAMARICALEAQVAELATHLERLFTAEAIIRRAEFGLPQPPPRRPERPRHLRRIAICALGPGPGGHPS